MNEREAIIIGGANGVGKTTWSGAFLADHPDYPFLNADNVAKEIAPDDPEGSAIAAGRIFLRQQEELIRQGQSFLLESTLSGRYLLKMIRSLRREDYTVRIVFLFLDSPETLIGRIKNRVAKGGHHISDDDVRRRFERGAVKFWTIYRPLVDSWDVFFNEGSQFVPVARGNQREAVITSPNLFRLDQDSPMKTVEKLSPADEERSRYYLRIGDEAIRQALEENRRLGLPNYFSRDGQTTMEMSDGSEVVVDTGKKRQGPPEAA